MTRTQIRPLTFGEMRGQLDALTASIAEGTRQAQELTARVARFEEAATLKVKTKADYYGEITAAATQRFGELSTEAAVSAYLATPESVPLFQQYRKAPHAAPAPVQAPDPLAGHGAQSRAAAEAIDRAADEPRQAQPSLSHTQAVDQALQREP